MLVTAALIALGIWVASSYIRGTDSVTSQDSKLSAAQHTSHLVRSLRVAAASDITPPNVASIPEATAGVADVECGGRFTMALEDAVTRMYAVDYLSIVAGSRSVDNEPWRVQQSQAHGGAITLNGLFPTECSPEVPVSFDLDDEIRFADGVSIRHMLVMSDQLVEEWSQLYLLAESAPEHEIALAGLWQIVQWEAAAGPGRSPFSLVW